MIHHWAFFRQQLRRELTGQYLGSFTGRLWVFVEPLILLAVYAFVFGVIFQARAPEARGLGFVPYLATGLWPWLAFSSALTGAQGVVLENAGLIQKVPVQRELLVLARVAAVYVLNTLGFVTVLLVMTAFGVSLHWQTLPQVLFLIVLLFLCALGLGWLLSALTVFIRDLKQVLPSLIRLAFFSTPIVWSPSMLPEQYLKILMLNPLVWPIMGLRETLLGASWQPGWSVVTAVAVALGLLGIGVTVFRRLAPQFEDFL